MPDFWIEDGETMLFIGDSITDCGRRDVNAPFGDGYMRMVTELATAQFPERKITYINKGIGGNTVTDLRDRWQEDVLDQRPDRLSIKIGINDLHQHLRGGDITPDLFEEIYGEILERTRTVLDCPLLLISPFYISNDGTEREDGTEALELLPRYIEVVEKMSARYETRLVRLHDIFKNHLKYRPPGEFCPEPVHPNHAGHLVIAHAVMDNLIS